MIAAWIIVTTPGDGDRPVNQRTLADPATPATTTRVPGDVDIDILEVVVLAPRILGFDGARTSGLRAARFVRVSTGEGAARAQALDSFLRT